LATGHHNSNQDLKRSFESRLKRQRISLSASLSSSDPSAATNSIEKQYFDQLHGLPFWIWNTEEHSTKYNGKKGFSYCCFNHAIGLPQKNNQPHPIHQYQHEIIEALDRPKLIAITKARGVGVSELVLR